MKQWFAKLFLKITGWKVASSIPTGIKKYVLIVAPHTSNMDYFIGLFGFASLGLKARILIKKEVFVFPFGYLLQKTGCIPVDRNKRNNLIQYSASLFEQQEELVLAITPEGTRSYNPHWKKGFYHIAILANVPIVLGYLDYAKKEGGLGGILYPTGDFKKDFAIIEDFYRDKNAKYPEKFNLKANIREN